MNYSIDWLAVKHIVTFIVWNTLLLSIAFCFVAHGLAKLRKK